MTPEEKRKLSERDICTKFITPALVHAGWDVLTQLREEVTFTDGRVIVKGKSTSRGPKKRADYVLYFKPGIPLGVVEAKDNTHSCGSGMQQALSYAHEDCLDVPFAISSNGDGFLIHDRTGTYPQKEFEVSLENFPSPEELWNRYLQWRGISESAKSIAQQDFYEDGSGKAPRYYQLKAINRTVEAIASGKNRALLVMATGTGKTYTAFQIIWRLWKSGAKKRILFLADRNILVDQTKTNDFKPFGGAMTKIRNRKADKSFEVFLSLYQAMTGPEERDKVFREFSPDFFDLIVIDECHRGSAKDDSAWREILDYFGNATHVGLTATPKETAEVSNSDYFGDPIYTYSLRQGIDDGFLAPYKVLRVDVDKDLQGWRPSKGQVDKFGNLIEDRIYNQSDFDRSLVIEPRTELVARLPNGVFASYTGIKTNLLFFGKGTPTKDIWFYEHPYPPRAKSYNKTKPIRIEEFDAEKKWWGKPDTRGGFKGRKASELAWKVTAAEIKANGYNLDIKNPHSADTGDPDELLAELESIRAASRETLGQLKSELAAALNSSGGESA